MKGQCTFMMMKNFKIRPSLENIILQLSTFPVASPSATTLSYIPGPPLTSTSSIELGRGRAEESQGSISLAPSALHRIGETIHPRPSTVTGATGTTQSRSRSRSRVETAESGGLYSNWRERWGRLNAASGGVRQIKELHQLLAVL